MKYKIQDIVTGLYQKEGYSKGIYPAATWSKRGKVWQNLDDLKSHLSFLQGNQINISPLWQIIEITEKNKKNYFSVLIYC